MIEITYRIPGVDLKYDNMNILWYIYKKCELKDCIFLRQTIICKLTE